jgi:xanthine dehydrogenase accessory factor
VLVRIATTKGSTPRDAGAFMLVGETLILGTVGGGRLEQDAMARARVLLAEGGGNCKIEMVLGPDTGQCCGGRVTVEIKKATNEVLADLETGLGKQSKLWPPVLVFGAGHLGRALAKALAPLPFNVTLVDTRPERLNGLAPSITGRATALPEAEVRGAPGGAIFIVVTHDHGLDFLITTEALKRGDARYVGLVGSATKRARFARWFGENGGTPAQFSALLCPIGDHKSVDKRPAVIAALTVAEILTHCEAPVSVTCNPVASGQLVEA